MKLVVSECEVVSGVTVSFLTRHLNELSGNVLRLSII
jgi:hypothetical protein